MWITAAGVLFLLEGAGQSGLALNWGDGMAADSSLISQYGISNTNPFYQALLKKPYLNQVVAAPHVYPPSISKATSATTVRPVSPTRGSLKCIHSRSVGNALLYTKVTHVMLECKVHTPGKTSGM